MSVAVEFADLEAACGRALRDASVCSGRVYSSIPRKPTFPLVTLERLGGIPPDKRGLDRARIQVSVWATSKSEARDWAEVSRRELIAAEGTVIEDAWITAVEDEMGLIYLPDSTSEYARERYVYSLAVYGRAYMGSSSS